MWDLDTNDKAKKSAEVLDGAFFKILQDSHLSPFDLFHVWIYAQRHTWVGEYAVNDAYGPWNHSFFATGLIEAAGAAPHIAVPSKERLKSVMFRVFCQVKALDSC